MVFQAKAEPPAMDELHRVLSLADEVLRHKILRIPEQVYGKLTGPGYAPSRPAPTAAAEPEPSAAPEPDDAAEPEPEPIADDVPEGVEVDAADA